MHALSRIYKSTLAFKARLLTLMLALPAITVLAFASAPVAHAQPDITIPTVLIDKPNNPADTTGYGSVSYAYNIGKTEVTNAQYAIFLNSAAKTDPYGLYNGNMGINQNGSPGSYVYTVKAGSANKPVTHVSFYDAARFCNWLTNGANADASTETGMYTLSEGELLTRNTDAFFVGGVAIASEDEWYKAAYYNLGTETYTFWATGDSINTNQANYDKVINAPTGVGSYPEEQNDTLDMMGNVWELNDGLFDDEYRVMRGGCYGNNDTSLASDVRIDPNADDETEFMGFRVSSLSSEIVIPEPATYGILGGAAALLGAVALRRRNRRD